MSNDIYAHLTEEDYASEVWKDIKGYEGLYQVSNLGRVKSLARTWNAGKNAKINRYSPERIMRLEKMKKGYLRACLSKSGSREKILAHVIVAKMFIDNHENKPQVNHKDGNKQNNKASNLEFVTNKENNNHAWENGLNDHNRKRMTGCNNHASKLENDFVVAEMRRKYATGNYLQKELAEEYGISGGQACAILNNKSRKSPTPVLEKH